MSPLRVEVYRGTERGWARMAEIKPNDPPGTMSNNLPDGTREVYSFSCKRDDSQSIIKKLPRGVDVETRNIRIIDLFELATAEVVATLRRGDEPYRITIKTDVSLQRRIVRFTHV